jgi:tetratricopeptide (TPR) repeat protein
MINKPSGHDGILLSIILVGLASVVGLSRSIDSHRPPSNATVEEEQLYLNGTTVRRISLGFNGLAADWYWMRSLQYVGGKLLNAHENIRLDDMSPLNLKLLAPLLDAATTLDPEFMEPYEYAAVILPGVKVEDAIRIINKGIAANPSAWRLYQHLGYIYWQQKDFKGAADAYGRGATIPSAPPWMEAMKAKMLGEGGSRDTAREIYLHMYQEAGDDQVKGMARRHLMRLDSLDEREGLRKILAAYQSRSGRCPSSWKDVEPVFRALRLRIGPLGAPLDPSGTPYVLDQKKCEVELDPKSEVPRQ